MPKTLQEWKTQASVKLEALAELLTAHLGQDGLTPRAVAPQGTDPATDILIPDPGFVQWKPLQVSEQPDKIVVYLAFPSSNVLVKLVSHCLHCPSIQCRDSFVKILGLYGIPVLELSGKTEMAQRSSILAAFKNGGRKDPRVLLLSGVGMTGLNIAFANILIMVVSSLF